MKDAADIDTPTDAIETEEEDLELQKPAEDDEQEAIDASDETADEGDADDGVVVTIGGEKTDPTAEDEERAPSWVRELRKANKAKDRKIRELEAQVAATKSAAPAIVVGEKPTLEGCGYDGEKFERELLDWTERKRMVEDEKREADKRREAEQEQLQQRINAYESAKRALKVRDFDVAEEVFREVFSEPQKGIILAGADKPEIVVYALGKNPSKARELAAIKDPAKFAFAAAKLETQMKVAPRKTAPPPERRLSGGVAGAAAVDNVLEKLREEAMKSGDMSKLMAYKRQARAKT